MRTSTCIQASLKATAEALERMKTGLREAKDREQARQTEFAENHTLAGMHSHVASALLLTAASLFSDYSQIVAYRR